MALEFDLVIIKFSNRRFGWVLVREPDIRMTGTGEYAGARDTQADAIKTAEEFAAERGFEIRDWIFLGYDQPASDEPSRSPLLPAPPAVPAPPVPAALRQW